MPSAEWTNEQGLPYHFRPKNTRKFRNPLLRGAEVTHAVSLENEFINQEWESGIYRIGCRLLRFLSRDIVCVKESQPFLRIEAVLKGELSVRCGAGEPMRLQQGQYHITDVSRYQLLFEKNSHCIYFLSYYSPELLVDLGIQDQFKPSGPRPMPERMIHILQEALQHPHQGEVKDLYYRRLVTELVYIHLTHSREILPAELSEADIAAVHEADAILSADLSEHYSIQQLSGMAGTNAFKLKKGFRLIFKMGVFGRLLYRRMEKAKFLLETTNKPIKDVAYEAGYDTVAGFITAFRKRFGKTPLDWREEKNGNTGTGTVLP
jgi:AraC-like DNA-binding protein